VVTQLQLFLLLPAGVIVRFGLNGMIEARRVVGRL
jgi:hypothetical protein